MKTNKLSVEWTGCYPYLCHGEWIIKYEEIELTIPEDKKDIPMDTYGEFGTWHFGEDCCEEWEYYTDGLEEDYWIRNNLDWIKPMFDEHDIEITDELLSELFNKIQEEDWRYNSCGGCI